MRPFVVAANWKMNKGPREAAEFLKAFLPRHAELKVRPRRPLETVLFAPAIDLWVVQEVLRNSSISFGGQNCHFEREGAFTGENSPQTLAEIGCRFVLVGHSERRAIFAEDDHLLAKKVRAAQECGLVPMLCVGETLAEREAGHTDAVITRQLRQGLAQVNWAKPLYLAYEPVWAIGTGKVATPEQANAAHVSLRKILYEIVDQKSGTAPGSIPILYGGSVKPENAEELADEAEIDGFLVGGASLKVDSFLALCATAKS